MKVRRAARRSLADAEARVTAARADVLATLEEIRHRLDPRVIVAETAEHGLARANALLDDAQKGARARPWLVALGATLFGIAVAARARLHAETDPVADDKETDRATGG